MGSQDNGQVANNAKIIVDNEGNKTYKEEDTGATYFETADGFLFKTENEQYTLIAYLGDEDTVTLPTDVNGKEYTIYQMSGIKNIVIPKTMRKIDDHAFENCDTLLSVTFEEGCCVESIGDMAFYSCKKLTNFIIPKTVVSIKNGAVSYCDSLISLASESGSLLTSIDGGAFQRCGSLKSVNFENSKQLAFLGSYVFYECQQLSNIILPNNIMNINQGAFSDTAYYNDLNNWNDGYLYIDDYLVKVAVDVKFVKVKDDTKCIATDAFYGCNKLINVEVGGNHSNMFSKSTNVETLILNELPNEHFITEYFGWNSKVPITFKRVVIRKGCEIKLPYTNLFANISGITIYVEDEKQACQWDNDYPGWNNGNRVYYGGEWINAEFKNADGEIIASDYYTVNQVIRQPFVDSIENGTKKLVFVGWDLDGDGIADNMPATSTRNISATAVMAEADNVVTVRYCDFDGSLYVKQNYVYGDTIVLPAALSKKGYMFDGWQGYTENMTVTSDLEFASLWTHEGGGHTFDTVTIEPTCTEKGYDRHTCSVCDYQYSDNFVDELGHNFGSWKVGTEPTCTEEGLEYRECSNCFVREEALIAAKGHNYTVKVITEPTCAHTGKKTYTCADCGTVETEILAKTEHKYKKHYVSKSWLEMLVERILNVFFGYEGENAFFYRCEVCGEIMTSSGMSVMSVSAQDTCVHELADWEVSVEPTHVEGIAIRKCSICGKAVEAKTLEADGTHTESNWIIDIEPTCAAKGLRHKECTFCGEILEYEVLSELGHDYAEEWTVDKEATCTEKGSKSHHCTRCSAVTEVTEIAANGHRYGETITVAATCEEAGYIYHVCETCGYFEKTGTLNATGHTEVVDEVKEATCTETGLTDGKHCSVCGKILKAQEVVAKKAHTESEWIIDVESTCETKGQRHVSCTNCGKVLTIEAISELGHQYSDEWTIDREATCTATGIKSRHCTRCSAVTDVTVLDIINHAYGDEIIVEATCEKAGYTYHVCATCGYLEKVRDIEAKGHTESGWITDSAAGCVTTGSQHKECTVCGKILDTQIINATGHNYGETLTVEATCEKAGYTYHVCATCGYLEKVEDIEAKGHTESGWITDVAATCGQDGYKHKECLTCGKILEKEYLDREKHSYGETLTVAATCEKGGYTYHVCEVCGRYEKIDDLSATGHTESGWIVDREATCAAEGLEHKECTVCGKILDTRATEADAHTYGETLTVEATCEKAGYTYHICEVCGHYEKIVDLPAQGHSHIIDWGKDATCTETGLTKGEHCGTCGKVFVEQEVIAKKAHAESEWIVDNAATCAGGGFRHKECLTCGEILKIEQINPNGHKYGDTLTVEATCEKAGYTYHVCETCGYSERTSTLNATGHTEVIDEAKAATCSETGLTAGKHCSVCGKVLKAQEVIAKKAHTESEWIVDSKAGCETAGSKHKECAVCKEILKIESIAAEGHTAGNYIVDYDATCESAGSKHKECEKCGKVLEKAQIAAKGHEYGEWNVDIEPTVNAEGREYRKCLRCEHREERSVERLKGGCGGSIYADGGLFAIILALAVSVVTTMKKRGKQR